jgi:hypothetical protein
MNKMNKSIQNKISKKELRFKYKSKILELEYRKKTLINYLAISEN